MASGARVASRSTRDFQFEIVSDTLREVTRDILVVIILSVYPIAEIHTGPSKEDYTRHARRPLTFGLTAYPYFCTHDFFLVNKKMKFLKR